MTARRCLTLALFLASELSASAQQTVHGVVHDAQDRAVAGADVVLSCADGTHRVRTAGDGAFSFGAADASTACDLTVRHAGFDDWHRAVRASRPRLIVTLTIAPLRETVNVAASPVNIWDQSSAGSSARRSAAELQPLGLDSRVWLDVMMNDAGAFTGQRRIYVDGLPADAAPDAARIGSIAVNADPFSAEFGGTDQNRVDITSAVPDRHWRFNAGGLSWIQGGSDALVERPEPDRRQRFAGMSGPVPHLPVTFFVRRSTFDSTEYPTYLAASAGGTLDAVPSTSSLSAWSFGAHVNRAGFAWQTAVDSSSARLENAGVGGLTAPDAGLRSAVISRRILSSWTMKGDTVTHRGGVLIVRSSTDSSAIAPGQARTVFGQLNIGGVDTLADTAAATRLYLRQAIDGTAGGRAWSAGTELSRSLLRDSPVPNPLGHLALETPGASSGTLIVQRGMPALQVTDTAGAMFFQGTAAARQRVLLRAGVRADWQDGEGLLLSPRATLVMRDRGFLVASGSGLFVEQWSPALFMEVRRRDGVGLETLVTPDVAPNDPAPPPGSGDNLSARFGSGAARRRDIVVQTILARGFGSFAASIDHRWTRGMALAGATRLRTPAGLVDVIDSDRGLTRHQIHLRTAVTVRGVAVTGHYEFAQSSDDTDGALSLPARQGDTAAEWGRSTGVARHHASLVSSLTLPGAVRAFVSASASSGSPYSIATGRDAERLAVFTDRGGAPRSNLTGPPQASVSVYASRRIELARARGLAFDIGVRAENVFDRMNVTAVGAVAGTTWAGRPLTALAGRSFNVWASVAR